MRIVIKELLLLCLADAEKQEKAAAHAKLIDEIRERNRQREHEATFTEIWYTFVDPYATDVDERGTGKYDFVFIMFYTSDSTER
jgi:hypothetical protein